MSVYSETEQKVINLLKARPKSYLHDNLVLYLVGQGCDETQVRKALKDLKDDEVIDTDGEQHYFLAKRV